jgi:uncharacterized SAM-binding protein YcdF (DUF218 family)
MRKETSNEMRIFRLRNLALTAIVVLLIVMIARQAARILVVDKPEKSDAIVVLAGETGVRPARAVELLRQGVAPHVFLDAEAALVYDSVLPDIAQRYINDLGEVGRVTVCPIGSFSTFAEADHVNRCLSSIGAHRVLIVTSDYHTRRALMIMRHRLPQYEFSVAAARDPDRFGEAWWTTREWAKNMLSEWTKIFWFEAVDRWR